MESVTEQVLKYLETSRASAFIGGVPTSMLQTGQQWDFPNAWPPLQHMIVVGLEKTGQPKAQAVAFDLAQRWLLNNYVAYQQVIHESCSWKLIFQRFISSINFSWGPYSCYQQDSIQFLKINQAKVFFGSINHQKKWLILLGWKLSPVAFSRWLTVRNTTWLSFQPNSYFRSLSRFGLCDWRACVRSTHLVLRKVNFKYFWIFN